MKLHSKQTSGKNFITRALTYVPHITGGLLAANLLGWGWGYYLAQHYTCRDCKFGKCPLWLEFIQALPNWIPKVQSYVLVLISNSYYADYYNTYCLIFKFSHGVYLSNLTVCLVVFGVTLLNFKREDGVLVKRGIQITKIEAAPKDIRLLVIFILCAIVFINEAFWGTGLRTYAHRRLDTVTDGIFTITPVITFSLLFPCIAYISTIGSVLCLNKGLERRIDKND